MRLTILAVFVLLATPEFAVQLFRYRGAARDGGTLEYLFETDEEHLSQTVAVEAVVEKRKITGSILGRVILGIISALNVQIVETRHPQDTNSPASDIPSQKDTDWRTDLWGKFHRSFCDI